MRSTSTLVGSNNPEVYELIAQTGSSACGTQTASAFSSAAEIARHALETQAAVHGLLSLLQGYGRYEPDLADTAYQAASGVIRRLEAALETVYGRFCETGAWIAGGKTAYEAILSAAVMCRGIRSQRLGLQDPARRVRAQEFDYAE